VAKRIKKMKYTIFSTAWGYFGLLADKKGLIRTCLPCKNRKTVEKRLLARLSEGDKRLVGRGLPRRINRRSKPNRSRAGLKNPQFNKNLLKFLQKQIIAYFAGKRTLRLLPSNFCLLTLSRLTPFARKVLDACMKIPAGKTVSYSQLAGMIGKPKASRAVGSALARNPIPLIIPCHRVVRADGSLGNFSAPGGTSTKKKLLALEKQ
jgi:methylated-DNA-[protein]-cysteine S-methyltransferase